MEDQQPDPDQPQEDYGEGNKELPEQLVEALRSTIKEFGEQEKYTRRREVLHDRRNRFYERGYQHVSWNQSGQFILGTPGAYVQNSQGESVQLPSYIDDYDIFLPYLRILISVLTQNLPGVNFQPIDPSISEDIDKAKTAEAYAKAFDRCSDVKSLMMQDRRAHV